MAKLSDYTITTFQRKPEFWRPSVELSKTSSADRKMKSVVTDQDYSSERDSELVALKMIRMMDE